MSGDESITLPAGLHAPAQARTWLSARADSMPPELLEDALLVTSELVTNAVRHGRPKIVLSLRRLPGGVRIGVGDEGEHLPSRTPSAPDASAPSGRGLLIVASTARDWGVVPYPDGPGKTIWAELSR